MAARDDRSLNGLARDDQFRALVDAMGHPVRSRLLCVIADKPGVTIRQIAARLDESERRVRHHLEILVAADLVAVDGEARKRNMSERSYRANRVPIIEAEQVEALTVAQQRRLSLEGLKHIMADARGAVANGTFGIHEGHCEVRYWAEVDKQGWEEIAAIQQGALDQTHLALERCKDRLQDGTPPSFPALIALLLFEAPGWD